MMNIMRFDVISAIINLSRFAPKNGRFPIG